MNRVYKVIYSKARQCCIVVSELAKSSQNSSWKGAGHVGTPALARIIAVALAAGALTWGSVPEVSWAADTASGNGAGVAIGTGSNAPKAENVAIGKGATIFLILMGHQALPVILWSVMEPISITMPVREAALPLVRMQR